MGKDSNLSNDFSTELTYCSLFKCYSLPRGRSLGSVERDEPKKTSVGGLFSPRLNVFVAGAVPIDAKPANADVFPATPNVENVKHNAKAILWLMCMHARPIFRLLGNSWSEVLQEM